MMQKIRCACSAGRKPHWRYVLVPERETRVERS